MTIDEAHLEHHPRMQNGEDLSGREGWAGAIDPFGGEVGLGPTKGVTGPGLAALNAGNDRAPRTSAQSANAPVDDRDNWRLTGPRNIGGRVTALAAEHRPPGDVPSRWFAGSASGGPYRSNDGGKSWHPLLHDEPSLAVGAIAVAPSDRDVVYVATGEINPAGFAIRGHGIWVSSNGGDDFDNHGVGDPKPANPAHTHGFDAIAVDPAAAEHCWAVGIDGIFRTANSGVDWQHIHAGTYYSDVAYRDNHIYLVRATSQSGEGAILRIDNPALGASAADIEAALVLPDNLKVVVDPLAAHDPWPARGKIALFQGGNGRGYVRFVDAAERHVGLFRCTDLRPVADSQTWTRMPDHHHWVTERQGLYNLAIAVDQADRTRLATGMVLVHASRDGGATWRRAMHWSLHDEGLRAHHADQHQFMIAGPSLWVGNDGGIAESPNWADGEQVQSFRPVGPGAIRWRRRDLGIAAAQMYDLNQSPTLPGLQAMGMQDNSSHMSAGGATWRQVGPADGAFVLFDPDDPFRYLFTTQNDVRAEQFPGHFDRHFPLEQPAGPVVTARGVQSGFLPYDRPAFVADSDRHPIIPGRVLIARQGRLYGARPETGERWTVEPVGTSFEIVHRPGTVDVARIEIAPTLGAIRLGLPPLVRTRHSRFEPLTHRVRRPATAGVASRLPGPYKLAAGDEVIVKLDGAEHRITFSASDAQNLDAVTVAEVRRKFDAALPGSTATLPHFWREPTAVEIVTRGLGAGQEIRVDGPALNPRADGLSRLTVNAGTYAGSAGMPASLTIGFRGFDEEDRAVNRDLSGSDRFTISVNGGPDRTVDLGAAPFTSPDRVTVGELASAVATAVADDDVDVVAADIVKVLELIPHDGHTVLATGTAAPRLGLPATEQARVRVHGLSRAERNAKHHRRNRNSFDLTPPGPDPLELTLSDGSTVTSAMTISATDVGSLRSVTVEELFRLVKAHGAAHPGLALDVELTVGVLSDKPNEIVFSSTRPDEAWVGTRDGRVLRTTNGVTWKDVGSPDFRLGDQRVEAIGLHPTNPQVAYVGLRSFFSSGHRATLFRTDSGGERWDAVDDIQVDGTKVGVHAVAVDPDAPDNAFVATDGGVFRSSDAGRSWRRFNEGLPNAPITDLAFEPTSRRLRAGVWGRGSFERRVGEALPEDVNVYLRASETDRGGYRPPPAIHDVFGTDTSIGRFSSPDIKYVQDSSPLGAGPFDGVEFDLDITNESVIPDTSGRLLVQVHNTAPFEATDVRIIALHAPGDVTPPPLPHDFWTQQRQGTLAGDVGDWEVLHDAVVGRSMAPDAPLVEAIPITWPVELAEPSVGVLVVVQASGDEIDDGALTVDGLIASERRAAYRQFRVVDADADGTLVLRSEGQFEVAAPDLGTDASAVLGLASGLGTVLVSTTLASPTYPLAGDGAIHVFEQPLAVVVDFDNDDGDFGDITQATPFEVAAYIDARFKAVGAQASCWATPVGLRLRGLGGATISPTGGRVRTRLGWAAGHVASLEALVPTPSEGWDLTGSGNPHLQLEIQAQITHAIDIAFDENHFRDLARADADRLSLLMNRVFAARQLEGIAECEPIFGLAVAADFDGTLMFDGLAAQTLRIPRGAPFEFDIVAPGLVDVDGESMTVTVRNGIVVRFDRYPDFLPDPTLARPPEVRRVLNEHFSLANMAVRAVVGNTRLTAAGLATSGTALAIPPDDLFELPGRLVSGDLIGGESNFVYVEVHSDGDVETLGVTHRLVGLDMTATPIGRTEVGIESLDVAAETVEFVEFSFDAPGDVDGVWLLATADLELPADWQTPQEVFAWVAANRGAALRRFAVG